MKLPVRVLRLASASTAALTHPHSDPSSLATATNAQVKLSVELGILGPALFIVRQRAEREVNTVYCMTKNQVLICCCYRLD